jgi:hypothetical protein
MSEHITSGIHDMPAEQYFASNATSNSDLKWIAPPYTPAHYRAYKLGQIDKEETEAMRIGTLTHRCILEPDKMRDSYTIRPDGMKLTTKDGMAWKAEQGEKIILAQKTADMIERMMLSVWDHPQAKQIISASDREQSLFADDDGLRLKSRVDCLPKAGNIIADLKTIELCDLDSVEKQIYNYGYFRQAAFYLRVAKLLGIEKSQFVLIFVEKVPPHCVALYSVDEIALEAGEAEISRDLTVLRHCVESGTWPGRETGINAASLPAWALKQMGNIL